LRKSPLAEHIAQTLYLFGREFPGGEQARRPILDYGSDAPARHHRSQRDIADVAQQSRWDAASDVAAPPAFDFDAEELVGVAKCQRE
jgi:hypothetical protein